MFQNILNLVEIVLSYIAYLTLAWIALEFLCWLVAALYRQVLLFIDWVLQWLVWGTARLGTSLKSIVRHSLSLVLNALLGGWLFLYQPSVLALQKTSCAVRQYVKLRQLFWKYGRQEFATFGKFKRHMLGEEEPSPKAKPEKPAPEKSGYAQALEVLGFSETAALDKTMLKTRHRELAAILHPDKEFPNQVFMQQVNDAVDYIKRAKKWR